MPVNTCAAWHGSRTTVTIVSIVLAILLVCSIPVVAAQQITKVQVANLDEKVQIGITATEPISFTVVPSQAGAFLAFDIKGQYVPERQGKIGIKSQKITQVRYGRFQNNPPVTRIALTTRGHVAYSTRFVDDKRMLVIDVWKTTPKPETQSENSQVQAEPETKPSVALSMLPAKTTPAPAPTSDAQTVSTSPAESEVTPLASLPVVQTDEVSPVSAQTREPVRVAAALSDSPARVIRSAGDSAEQPAVRNIGLDFVAADINDVLKALSVQSGVNIISGADVKGQITVSLNRASIDEALNYVAKLSGFEYAKADEGTYVVGNNVGALLGTSQGGNVTEIVRIAHANPARLTGVLKDLVPAMKTSGGPSGKEAESSTPSGGYSLVLSGSARDVALAKDVVAQLEASLGREQENLTTQAYKIKYSDSNDLIQLVTQVIPSVQIVPGPTTGFKLDGKETVKVGLSGDGAGDYQFKLQPDVLILTGPSAEVSRAIALLQQVDVRQPQILIEAEITDLSETAARELGLKWDFGNFAFQEIGSTRRFERSPFSFRADLDAQAIRGNAKILAKPRISVVDGKPANIFIGDEIKYIISIQQTPQGQNIQTETALVGVQLRVIPKVNDEGVITLNIHPEVSVITDFLRVGDLALPQIARRFTDSTIRVRDGQTIVIGGLIRDSEIQSLREVPLLSRIPFFGELFRHRSTQTRSSEVVVFITARLVQE